MVAAAEPGPAAAPLALRAPPPLRPGDRVALFSPSGHLGEAYGRLTTAAREVLAGWGLRVDPLPAAEPRHRYFAGDDAFRAAQFQALYADPEVRGLFMTRGGYGAGRLVPLLDAAALRAAPPKVVVGFSDATALFAWLHTRVGVQAIHGPGLASAALVDAPRKAESLIALRALVFGEPPPTFPLEVLHLPPEAPPGAAGPLVGGCLSVWQTTLGTPWEVPTAGTVLFLEEVDEAPYRIDRMLNHLRTAGRLAGVRALVLGQFVGCGEPEAVREALADALAGAPCPVFTGLPAGHGDPNLALPLGRPARLDWGPGGAGATLRFP